MADGEAYFAEIRGGDRAQAGLPTSARNYEVAPGSDSGWANLLDTSLQCATPVAT